MKLALVITLLWIFPMLFFGIVAEQFGSLLLVFLFLVVEIAGFVWLDKIP